MNIGEFERATGLKRSTIRVYEAMGLLVPDVGAGANGYRVFTPAHVERVGAIRLAKALGFSLREIAVLMDAWEGGRLSKAAKLNALEARLADVETKRRQLTLLARWLKSLIDWVRRGETGPKPKLG